MVDKRRFWQLFLRQFCLLLAISLGMVAFLYFSHSMAHQTDADWIRFAAIDLAVLLAASAATARLRLLRDQQRERDRNRPRV
jgi:TRAP-type C4-dicarboxylate transport system permease small subunit